MRATALSVIWIAGVGCGVADPDRTGEVTEAINYGNNIFYDKFDDYTPGSIDGQGGWAGDCTAGNGVLSCTGGPGFPQGRGALNTFDRPANRNYRLQFDVWTVGVTLTPHGKLFLENPPGDGSKGILQVEIGCGNVSAIFEYHSNTQRDLLNFKCDGGLGPRIRVVCIWHDLGTEFRCGAAMYPYDPEEANFITIPAVNDVGGYETIHAFDRVRVLGGIGERTGTTVFEKLQILSD